MTIHPGEPCPQCGHDFDLHVLILMAGGVPADGGFIICPEGCDCIGTWQADESITAEHQSEFESLFDQAPLDSVLDGTAPGLRERGNQPSNPGDGPDEGSGATGSPRGPESSN